MTLRTHLTTPQRLAHEILDLVKNNLPVDKDRIKWALVVLGDVE